MSTVAVTGSLFNGRAQKISKVMLQEMIDASARVAFDEVHRALDENLQNPSGYYESTIVVERSRKSARVHDQGVVYGRWLVTGRRHRRKTKFKGYRHWRQAQEETQRQVPETSAPIVKRRVAEMNR